MEVESSYVAQHSSPLAGLPATHVSPQTPLHCASLISELNWKQAVEMEVIVKSPCYVWERTACTSTSKHLLPQTLKPKCKRFAASTYSHIMQHQ
ncbi:uncharacterized protein [Misgurnus anguillicaudatus]|uniref:uncharacterized protein isoform X2 n=1 Tax=Misgurnus anguillicaudatus TaxID=75329 RepID=UPI003CCEFD7D